MSKPDNALLAKLSQLSPEQREALLQKLKQNAVKNDAPIQESAITPLDRQQAGFELSYAQRRLWFQEQLNPHSSTYHIACAIRFHGSLDRAVLAQSLEKIIERHESLRTVFISDANGVKQHILPSVSFDLPLLPTNESKLDASLKQDAKQSFDLSQAPLMRCKLYPLADNETVLSLVMHHIISDAWSSDILLAEISQIYSALIQGTTPVLPALTVHYVDFAAWQKSEAQQARFQQQAQYWQEKLKNISNLQLPLDKPRPSILSQNGSEYVLTLDDAVLEQFKALCQAHNATLYHGLLAAFQCLLFRYTGQTDFAIGTPIAGRTHRDTQALMGFFVNTQALRCDVNAEDSFIALLKKVRQSSIEALTQQDLPFEQLLDHLAVERDGSYSPIFQVFFSYQLADYQRSLQLANIQAQLIPLGTDSAKFDLSLVINANQCHFEFNSDLFEAASIEQMAQHFQQLLKNILEQNQLPVSKISMLNDSEIAQQLHITKTAFAEKNIKQLFEQQVEKTPEQIAVVQGNQRLSFTELNQKANRLAHYLQAQNLHNARFIAIAMPPCLELSISILAVIKLGIAYLPLDPSYPVERLNTLLAQANTNALIRLNRSALPDLNAQQSIALDSLDLSAFSDKNPDTQIDFHAPLYAIFTSGSTGMPKAAMVSHANESNLLHWYKNAYQLEKQDNFLVFSAIGFDLTQKNLLAPLCFGAKLTFCSEEQFEPNALLDCIENEQITWLNCAPSAFYALLQKQRLSALNGLKKVFFGGEPIQIEQFSAWFNSPYFNASLTNMYGPTECTDIACAYRFGKNPQHPVPIGKAAANVELLLLDPYLNLLPKGAIGELYIGGAGLGLGYLNNEAANQRQFIAHPFRQGEKLYKTGDLARRNAQGEWIFIGRADGQLKIRGFRIELGEIESQLRLLDGVDDAVVCAQLIHQQTQLIAFIKSAAPLQSKAHYRKLLQKQLPTYMLPVYFAPIAEIPLSANGKIDRKQLPPISEQQLQNSSAIVAPRNATEAALLGIWQEVLAMENISVFDNFFELGGNSLSASQVATRIMQQFQLDLPLRSLFEVNTIEGLAELIAAMQVTLNAEDEDVEEGLL